MNQKQIRVFIFATLLVVFGANSAFGQTIYDNIINPLPGNWDNYAFEANGTSELGDRIMFAPATGRSLNSVVLTMSNYGCQSGHWFSIDCVTNPGATFSHPITLNIYNVGPLNQPGTLIGSVTQNFALPYRPTADVLNCTGASAGAWFDAASSTCFFGQASNITFNLSGLVVPDQVIFGIAFNTTHYGYSPIGQSAPCYSSPGGCGYDALNVGIAYPPTVGSNPAPNDAYQYTVYSSCTNGPIIPFGLDAGCWTGFKPAIRFNAGNAPTSKDDCKNGGWQNHTTASGASFSNQGQCIQYFITGK
jgi:hypothetical protein